VTLVVIPDPKATGRIFLVHTLLTIGFSWPPVAIRQGFTREPHKLAILYAEANPCDPVVLVLVRISSGEFIDETVFFGRLDGDKMTSEESTAGHRVVPGRVRLEDVA
jgi:hypothetical protein